MDSSVLALPLSLVGREMGLGCVLGTYYCGWVRFFASALAVLKFGWGFLEILLVSLPVVTHGEGLAYSTLDQCVSPSLIDVVGVQPPA